MATTKKTSTKAKTKTSKAKATTKKSTPKKTTAAKTQTVNKTSKTTVSAKKATSAAKRSRPVTVQRLRSLHLMSAGLFLLLAVLAGVFMNSTSYQLTLGHIAKDELSGVFVPAVQAVYDVEARWLVVATMVLAGLFPVLHLTRLKDKYAEYVNNTRVQPWRWIEFAVAGALVAEVVALLSGVSDVPTLKLIAGLVVATAVFGLVAERQNNASGAPARLPYYAGLFTGLVVAAFVGVYLIASVMYGTGVAWYVYAAYAIAFGGFLLSARNLRAQLNGANYLVSERNYIVVGTLTKVAFAAVLIAGLLR